jgi:hypothetical protein
MRTVGQVARGATPLTPLVRLLEVARAPFFSASIIMVAITISPPHRHPSPARSILSRESKAHASSDKTRNSFIY